MMVDVPPKPVPPVTPPEKVRCDYCKGLFVPDRKWQHFCSEKCRNGWHNDKRALMREKKRKN